MRNTILAGAAAIALSALPAFAQEAGSQTQSANSANAEAAPPPPTTTVVTDNNSATPTVVARNYPGNLTPPPASALNKTYPVCRGQVQDSCQNPGEGGAPGKSRALPYWPGQPASETDVGG